MEASFLVVLCGLCFLVATAYYGVILGGWMKDPMMAHFRVYGQEQRIYPLPRFLWLLGVDCFLGALLFPLPGVWFPMMGLMMMLFAGAWVVDRRDDLRAALPLWYARLIGETDRLERRAIAWAWARLPYRTRMRLNGDRYAFSIFIDEVRLTVVYGARPRDDPWAYWN